MLAAETDNCGELPGLFLHPGEKTAAISMANSTLKNAVFISSNFIALKNVSLFDLYTSEIIDGHNEPRSCGSRTIVHHICVDAAAARGPQ